MERITNNTILQICPKIHLNATSSFFVFLLSSLWLKQAFRQHYGSQKSLMILFFFSPFLFYSILHNFIVIIKIPTKVQVYIQIQLHALPLLCLFLKWIPFKLLNFKHTNRKLRLFKWYLRFHTRMSLLFHKALYGYKWENMMKYSVCEWIVTSWLLWF